MAERPRVLYIQPNSEVGGSDLALLRMVESLDRDRFEPVAVLPKEGPMVTRLREAGAQVHLVPMMQLRTLPSPGYHLRYLAQFWPTVFRLGRLIRRERIALVHSNSLYSLYGAFAAGITRTPHLWHVREIPPQVPVARPALARLVLALSTRVISMTQACSAGLFARQVHAKVELLAEGLDFEKWSRRPGMRSIRAELGIAPDEQVVGFVARLDPWKGLDVFLRAAALVSARCPGTIFLVSGDAPAGFESYRDRMVALAGELGIADKVRFLGWTYRLDDIPALMADLDVFCHTSIQPEPFGLVLIEAMAMGCPVVAARAGGPLEIVEDGVSGLLTPPGDAEAVADAVTALLDDPVRRRAIATNGRLGVESRYSKAAFRERLRELYETVLDRRGA